LEAALSKPIPIYRERGEMHFADTCEPLTKAWQRGEVTLAALKHGHYPGNSLPQGELSGLKTIGFWHADREQTWELPWHRNEGLELTFLETGHLSFDVDDRCYGLKPGDLTITRPWQRHRVGYPNVTGSRLHWLILDLEVRRPNQAWEWPSWLLLSRSDRIELTNMLRHCEQPVWKGSGEIRRVFRAISQAVEGDRKGSHLSRLAIL
jgi:AraC family L-rhamnose operon regulatory protein RhaS